MQDLTSWIKPGEVGDDVAVRFRQLSSSHLERIRDELNPSVTRRYRNFISPVIGFFALSLFGRLAETGFRIFGYHDAAEMTKMGVDNAPIGYFFLSSIAMGLYNLTGRGRREDIVYIEARDVLNERRPRDDLTSSESAPVINQII